MIYQSGWFDRIRALSSRAINNSDKPVDFKPEVIKIGESHIVSYSIVDCSTIYDNTIPDKALLVNGMSKVFTEPHKIVIFQAAFVP
jgi:hypothetical protein